MADQHDSDAFSPPAIDPKIYREIMGHYPTGVVVVTGITADREPAGMVVGTFAAVSLDPPLVSFMPTRSSETFSQLRTAESYCVNVLAADQSELCRIMGARGSEKFASVEWKASPLGAPMLADAVAYIHCVSSSTVEAGDHLVELCEVRAMEVGRGVAPLLFFQGGYGGFAPRTMSAKTDVDLIAAVRLSEVARPQIDRLSRDFKCEAAVLVAVGEEDLMTTASAYGGDAEMREPLGQRIPLIPPIGESYVAWAAPHVVERWLGRASDQSPESLSRYRERLNLVRERGWAMARVNPEDQGYARLLEALEEYSSGSLTPSRSRAVAAVISESTKFFEDADLDDSEEFDVGSLTVPVINPDGSASLLLRVMQLPGRPTGSEIRSMLSALASAAAEVSRRLAKQDRTDLAEYQQWFEADVPVGVE